MSDWIWPVSARISRDNFMQNTDTISHLCDHQDKKPLRAFCFNPRCPLHDVKGERYSVKGYRCLPQPARGTDCKHCGHALFYSRTYRNSYKNEKPELEVEREDLEDRSSDPEGDT